MVSVRRLLIQCHIMLNPKYTSAFYTYARVCVQWHKFWLQHSSFTLYKCSPFFFFCTNYFATRWQHRPRPVSQSEKKRGRQNKNKNHENKLLKTSKTIFTHINQHLCEGIKRYFQLKRRYWTRINVSNITACCHFVCEFTNLRVKKWSILIQLIQ